MKCKIQAEWDNLSHVAVHLPGIEMYFGLLDPFASLYERSFNMTDALKEHELLSDTLKYEFNVNLFHLHKTITDYAEKSHHVHEKLVELAQQSILYTGDTAEVNRAYEEAYRNKNVLDTNFYFNNLLLKPHVDLKAGKGTRMIHFNVTENEPLSNLYFMRDQQTVTDQGMVLSSMAKPQRKLEPQLTKFLWNTLEIPIIHEFKDPATFEGGDFFPLGDFALVGTGDRSNNEGVKQLLEHCIGFNEVAVVKQPSHPLLSGDVDQMINMHLDTYINFASDGVAVGSKTLLKEANIEIYQKEHEGKYVLTSNQMNLYDYIISKGFNIIDITTLEQMAFATNFLCMGNNTIISADVKTIAKDVLNCLKSKAMKDRRYIALFNHVKNEYKILNLNGQFFPNKKEIYQNDVDVYTLNLLNLTGGYGGAHCMTCALSRK